MSEQARRSPREARSLDELAALADLDASPEKGARLLVAAEVAELLAVSPRWIRDATREGRLPVVRLGKFCRYRREAIEAWIEAHEVPGRGTK